MGSNDWGRCCTVRYRNDAELTGNKRTADLIYNLLFTIYDPYTFHILGFPMGIVKISDELHEEIRKSSSVMVRSINAQAEYWIKIGMLAEANPSMSFSEIIHAQMKHADVDIKKIVGG